MQRSQQGVTEAAKISPLKEQDMQVLTHVPVMQVVKEKCKLPGEQMKAGDGRHTIK